MADSKQTILNRLILLQCGHGKPEGFETLVKSWEQPLFYYVRRMVGSEEDAWDVMQEVWLRAFRGVTSVREPGAPCSGPLCVRNTLANRYTHSDGGFVWSGLENTCTMYSRRHIHASMGHIAPRGRCNRFLCFWTQDERVYQRHWTNHYRAKFQRCSRLPHLAECVLWIYYCDSDRRSAIHHRRHPVAKIVKVGNSVPVREGEWQLLRLRTGPSGLHHHRSNLRLIPKLHAQRTSLLTANS